jgi:predicted ester cyclase
VPNDNPAESHRAAVIRFYDEVWNRGRVEVAHELFAPNYVRHDLRPGTPPPGPEGQVLIAARFRAGFPDMQFHVDAIVAENDMVAARWTIVGTHSGEWNGRTPTRRKIRYAGMNLFRFAHGRIVEIWNHRDDLGLLEQLGLIAGSPAGTSIMYEVEST